MNAFLWWIKQFHENEFDLWDHMWLDVWLLFQMLNWRHLVKWRQNYASNYYGFLEDFHRPTKNCKQLFSDNIIYKWYKYIISLQNYLIKLTPNVLIKMYRPYICHVHRSWCSRHLLRNSDIIITQKIGIFSFCIWNCLKNLRT